jgi:hypothetical protein
MAAKLVALTGSAATTINCDMREAFGLYRMGDEVCRCNA